MTPNSYSRTLQAVFFLREVLHEGPMDYSRISRMAEARSMSNKLLYRAARLLGVKITTKGFGHDKHSIWSISRRELDRYSTERMDRLKSYRWMHKELQRLERDAETAHEVALITHLHKCINQLKSREM